MLTNMTFKTKLYSDGNEEGAANLFSFETSYLFIFGTELM